MRGRVGLPGTILSFSLRTLRFYNSCEIVIKKTRAISIFVGEFSLSRYGKGKCCNRFTPRTGFLVIRYDLRFNLGVETETLALVGYIILRLEEKIRIRISFVYVMLVDKTYFFSVIREWLLSGHTTTTTTTTTTRFPFPL